MATQTAIPESDVAARASDTRGATRQVKLLALDVKSACWALVISAAILTITLQAHTIHPGLAVLLAFCSSLILAQWNPSAALVTVLFALMFQNTFVAIMSPVIGDLSGIKIAKGYNFVILSAVWITVLVRYLLKDRGRYPALDRFMNVTLGLFVLVGFFFLLGFVQNPLPAVIYLRGITTGLMLFQLCVIIFAISAPRLTAAFTMLFVLVAFCGYMELMSRESWYWLTNGEYFWRINAKDDIQSLAWDKLARERGIVVKSVFDDFTVELFNTPLLSEFKISITRLLGPNLHPISFAYMLAFFVIFMAYRGAYVSTAILLPLLIFTNAKGALILLILVFCAWVVSRLFGVVMAIWALVGALALYLVLGITVGLDIGDFHVLGFMGGVYNFLGNPFGHGIGVGGNLGTNFAKLDWPAYQAAGRTPIALESAVGVLMYQMGVAAFIYLGVMVWLAIKTIMVGRVTGQSLHVAAGLALITLLVNGVFQEEALFSPLSIGLLMALNGMILGAAIKGRVLRA